MTMLTLGARIQRALLFVVAIASMTFAWVAPVAAQVAPSTARIHYHRAAADYAGWQLYTWYGALNPSPQWNPAQPPSGSDAFGVYYDVADHRRFRAQFHPARCIG
jgi:hypothetical protein